MNWDDRRVGGPVDPDGVARFCRPPGLDRYRVVLQRAAWTTPDAIL